MTDSQGYSMTTHDRQLRLSQDFYTWQTAIPWPLHMTDSQSYPRTSTHDGQLRLSQDLYTCSAGCLHYVHACGTYTYKETNQVWELCGLSSNKIFNSHFSTSRCGSPSTLPLYLPIKDSWVTQTFCAQGFLNTKSSIASSMATQSHYSILTQGNIYTARGKQGKLSPLTEKL